MTIKKGEAWGWTAIPDTDLPTATTDHELARFLHTSDRPVILRPGGDLATTVGARDTTADPTAERPHLPVDLGVVEINGVEVPFVAHVIVRNRLWRGETIGIFNAAFLNEWNVTPRAHPNDGKLDVVTATLRFGDRLKARKRLESGTHVPHPQISIRRKEHLEIADVGGRSVVIDGIAHGRPDRLNIRIIPDAGVFII